MMRHDTLTQEATQSPRFYMQPFSTSVGGVDVGGGGGGGGGGGQVRHSPSTPELCQPLE